MKTKKPTDGFTVMKQRVQAFSETITNTKLREMFTKCFYNTLDTTTELWEDGTTYIFTGDISAMWLRDSSAQVMQYLEFADVDADVASLIRGLIKRQFAYVRLDPYANAFGKKKRGHWWRDICEKRPYVWERKFELDSLCYPLWLCVKYYDKTRDSSIFDEEFLDTLRVILGVFVTEQHHKAKSPYRHYRPTEAPSFSVPNKGYGGDVAVCGLVWSGYRPSDDPLEYGYFVPGNMFICCVLRRLAALGDITQIPEDMRDTMTKLVTDIDTALRRLAVVHTERGDIFAYEVDGLGGTKLMDDANVPSLLSIPYIGYLDSDDALYRNTRDFVLSAANPYYYSGSCMRGIGSPHTPAGYVWHISMLMQGLTASDRDEINAIVDTLTATDADTGYMHEGVYKDDAKVYTRDWFAWANSLFALFILKRADMIDDIDGGVL